MRDMKTSLGQVVVRRSVTAVEWKDGVAGQNVTGGPGPRRFAGTGRLRLSRSPGASRPITDDRPSPARIRRAGRLVALRLRVEDPWTRTQTAMVRSTRHG